MEQIETAQAIEMQRINIKPSAPDVLVRKENGMGFLDAAGESVPLTTYYRRRIMDGDVIEMAVEEPVVNTQTQVKAEASAETEKTTAKK